ncbi:MAG: acyltransferase [Deltaproteobacteria bacterium]|nr:acyltransferase [Deltaproteobacteria bacterium]
MKLGFVQTLPVFGDVKRNVARALEMAASCGAQVVVLPELFSTGYKFADKAELTSLAETADGPTVRAALDLAGKNGIWICGGFAERSNSGCFNSAFLAGPGGLVGIYRKTHLFADEKDIFLPGDTGFQVFDVGSARVGMMICFDWIFPEAARTLALRGADIILHPSNLVLPHCPDAMVTRCIENRVFAATADRVGSDDRAGGRADFIGMSEIVTPDGKVLVRASKDREETAAVEIDPARARDKRATPQNDLFADRRPEMYSQK